MMDILILAFIVVVAGVLIFRERSRSKRVEGKGIAGGGADNSRGQRSHNRIDG